MANELRYRSDVSGIGSGASLYAVVSASDGRYVNTVTGALESPSSANWPQYAVELVESPGVFLYQADFPASLATVAGTYDALMFLRSGLTPAPTDVLLVSYSLVWPGTGSQPSAPASGIALSSLDDLLTRISPYLAMCPQAIQQQALRDAFFRFCTGSEAWRESVDHTTAEGETQYSLIPEGWNVSVVRAAWATLDETPVAEWTYEVSGSGMLTFVSAPAAGQALRVEVVFAPSMDATEGPTWMLNRYWRDLATGAEAMLRGQALMPWSSPSLAVQREREFLMGLSSARQEALTRRRSGEMKMQAVPFI